MNFYIAEPVTRLPLFNFLVRYIFTEVLDMIISFLEGLKFGSAKYDLFIRLPIMYYLTGDKSKGMEFINNVIMNYPEDYLFTEKYISNFEKL